MSTEPSKILIDDSLVYTQMAMVEKYEQLINYCYPILQNIPRKHGIARDFMLNTLFNEVDLLIQAGKSNTVSRVYAADANLALLRFWLRFAVHTDRRLITNHQHRAAQAMVAEVGKMIGAWIKTAKGRG